jgi:hypothetical protein
LPNPTRNALREPFNCRIQDEWKAFRLRGCPRAPLRFSVLIAAVVLAWCTSASSRSAMAGNLACVQGLAVRKLGRFFEEVKHGAKRLELG